MAKWQCMPESNGSYWFCHEIKNRDMAYYVGVSKIEWGNGEAFLEGRMKRPGYSDQSKDLRITPDLGWWLKINDERMTAEVEE